MAILKVLHASGQLNENSLVSSAAIRAHTRIGYEEMTQLLEKMVAAGWVGKVELDLSGRRRWKERSRATRDNWVLLTNPHKLRLADVYRLFIFGGTAVDKQPPADDTMLTLDTAALANEVEAAVEAGLGQTLAQHFEEGSGAAGA